MIGREHQKGQWERYSVTIADHGKQQDSFEIYAITLSTYCRAP